MYLDIEHSGLGDFGNVLAIADFVEGVELYHIIYTYQPSVHTQTHATLE